jgi:histidine ammonia-lyase
MVLVLDGETLSPQDLYMVSRGQTQIELSKLSLERVTQSREVIENILRSGEVVYVSATISCGCDVAGWVTSMYAR